MLDFVKTAFRGFFAMLLWVNLIICAIGGGIAGNLMGGYSGSGHPIIGVIGGLIVGILINIVGGGFIATILNIDENIEQLKNSMENGSSSGSSPLNLANVSSLSPMGNSRDTWVCKKCNERNPNTASSCKGCGGYK